MTTRNPKTTHDSADPVGASEPGVECPSITRREVLSGLAFGATLGISSLASAPAFGRDDRKTPAEKVTIGVIGFGPRCTYVMNAMLGLPDVRCVAIADVQKSRRESGKSARGQTVRKHRLRDLRRHAKAPRAKGHRGRRCGDRRPMAHPGIDPGGQAGKDVYCEKPCGLSIKNVQDLAAVMKKTGRVFQAGTQRRSMPQFQKAVELARGGKLGKLDTLYASVYMPDLGNTWLPAEPTPAVDVCDWNLWLGPSPWRPYNSAYVAGQWRNQFDFESGARLIDWGAHTVDQCQWANDADKTTPVEFVPGKTDITCRYANGVKLVLTFLKTPFGDRGPIFNNKVGVCPVKFVGSDGSVEVGDEGIEVKHGGAEARFEPTKLERFHDARLHARNFFDCVRSRKPTITNPDVMRQSHLTNFAASFSWILGRKLEFDPKKNEFVGDAEANSLRSRPERNCWA